MSKQDTAKRAPTPDEYDKMCIYARPLALTKASDARKCPERYPDDMRDSWCRPCVFVALEAQRDQLQLSRIEVGLLKSKAEIARDQLRQAREIIDALNRLRHLSSGSAIIARLDPILEKAAAFKRANPAPAATKRQPTSIMANSDKGRVI